jgi:hypothetical protein
MMKRNRFGAAVVSGAAAVWLMLATGAAYAQSPGAGVTLPPNVAKSFKQAYPAATIATTSRESDNGSVVYRVEALDKGKRRVVLYDEHAGVVQLAEQVEEKDLPAPVAAAMHSHPRAIYVSGMKVTRQGRVRYELTLRGTRKTAMVAEADGTVLSFK